MTDSSRQLAQQLLDAQVAFWLNDLSAERLQPLLSQELDYLYHTLGTLPLRKVASEEKVKATALRYATEMEIAGAIPELFGEIASIIYQHPHNDNTTLGELVTEHRAHDLLEKIFEPGSLLDEAVTSLRGSEPVQTFLTDLVFTTLKHYLLESNQLMQLTPLSGGFNRVRDWLQDKAPSITENINLFSRNLTEVGVANTLEQVQHTLDNDLYRDNALNSVLSLWDQIQTWPVSRFQDYVSEMDLQELMVWGYEFWLELRHTDYLKSLIDAGVEFFFDKYGDESLQTVTLEMGVTQEMIQSELLNYLPDLASLLVDEGFAETIIRRHLKRFYFDEGTLALLINN